MGQETSPSLSQPDANETVAFSKPKQKKLRVVLIGSGVILALLAVGTLGYFLTPWLVGSPLSEYKSADYSVKIPNDYIGSPVSDGVATRFVKRDAGNNITSGVIVSVQHIPSNFIDPNDDTKTIGQINTVAEETLKAALEKTTDPAYHLSNAVTTKTKDQTYHFRAELMQTGKAPSIVDAAIVIDGKLIYVVNVVTGNDPSLAYEASAILDSFTLAH